MTKAVCFKCGEMKFGAWRPCPSCGVRPVYEDEFDLSTALTDHFFELEDLEEFSARIKRGIVLEFVTDAGEPWPGIFTGKRDTKNDPQ
jgi:hypothetical protein